ncbi:helix-turn-helix domain-containing protein [Myceligenerans salitolerans]|uniref:ImmA/IrrE family metallo-endopeptidase n=1 Tax=Myceligenerans salitolerans TaxID=1230528 RepID=A0ABS3I8L9_9MICO|nr:XRE family transcriptional regulator [Myceligenerans salitolerans]MBO0609366.1 ImmA/IrrE family metallo-endopeptidase [Myceligenerans salitolerans]
MAKPMPITGTVLQWALRDRGLDVRSAAEATGVTPATIRAWIAETKAPNKGQFNSLVKLLGCKPSFLFLPEPPRRPRDHAVEFRKYSGAPSEVPAETSEAVRRAASVLKVSLWLAGRREEDSQRPPPVPRAQSDEDPEAIASQLRSWLNWSLEEQTNSGTTDTSAAKALRNAIQRRGVLVLHMTMDEGVTRGFSLHENDEALIAVNTRDHVRARMFSYAHELAHLTLRDDSVCLTRSNDGIEGFCNRVAAALLMPQAAFRNAVTEKVRGRVSTVEDAKKIRNYFRVSIQAAAIRAETLGLAPATLYQQVLAEADKKIPGGRYTPGTERTKPRIRVDQYGWSFVSSVLDAEESGTLKRSQVLDLLKLSDKELETARGLAMEGAVG